MGEGDPIIFQHGNPTSSYLWRNILPQLQSLGRCIAMDLIGMGDSEKLKDAGSMTYSYATHKKYFDGFLDELGVKNNAATGVRLPYGMPISPETPLIRGFQGIN